MNAGAYTESIVIEKNRIITDDIGNQSAVWEEYYKGYAYMNNLSGVEYWAAAQVQSESTVIFILRYHKLLAAINTRGYHLLHGEKIYNIESIDNVQYKNETIKIRATTKE